MSRESAARNCNSMLTRPELQLELEIHRGPNLMTIYNTLFD